jgi:preprotein translocase SecE subunit
VPGDPARAAEGYEAAPDSIAHAAPDAELADAQMALGRPELADGEAPVDETELAEEALDSGRRPGRRGGEAQTPATGAAVAERTSSGNRLVTFLQGSWRELQRVQWPDRRQVMQATGVVIGFVIVAGVFLGVADAVANKLVNLILQ